jgi:intein-encoded DNA endonuclease-like protein
MCKFMIRHVISIEIVKGIKVNKRGHRETYNELIYTLCISRNKSIHYVLVIVLYSKSLTIPNLCKM